MTRNITLSLASFLWRPMKKNKKQKTKKQKSDEKFSTSSFSLFLLLSLHYAQVSSEKVTRNVKQAWSKFELTHSREWNFSKVIPVLKGDNIRYAHVSQVFSYLTENYVWPIKGIVGDAKPLRSLVVSFFSKPLRSLVISFFLNQVLHHEFHSNNLTIWQKAYVVDAIFWADLCGKGLFWRVYHKKGYKLFFFVYKNILTSWCQDSG